MNSSREWVDPVELLGQFGVQTEHIVFDESVTSRDCDYRVIRRSRHDGTLIFTYGLYEETLGPLVRRESCLKSRQNAPAPKRYRVGLMRCAAVYGVVDVPAGKIHGMRESMCVPVRCEYD